MTRLTLLIIALLWLPASLEAAFPQVVGTPTTSRDIVSDTTHTITLPGSMTTGNLVMLFWAGDATDATPNFACTGFTVLEDQPMQFNVGHLGVAYRTVNGSEGASVNCSTDLAEIGTAIAIEISGWHGTSAPEDGGGVNGGGTTPDPESLTPSWGAEDTMWIAAASCKSATCDFTAYPATYGNDQTTGTQSGGTDIALATRELNATSDDPGTFTDDNSSAWAAVTIGVRPAVGGAANGSRMLLLGVGR